MAQFVKKNTFLILSLIGQISYIDTGITTRLADKNECTNTDITFDWTYDFQTDLESASWKRGTTPIIIKPAGGVPEVQPGYESKIQYISGGQMKILNAELTDSATYTLDVAYTLGSGHSSDSDSVIVNIQDPPAVPTGNCTDSQCKCYVTYLGSPAGILKIKVNDDASQTPAEITSLRDAKKVYCCVEGNSVKCLPQNTDRGSEYCVDIYEGTTTTLTSSTTTNTTTSTTSKTVTTIPTPLSTTASATIPTTISIATVPTASRTSAFGSTTNGPTVDASNTVSTTSTSGSTIARSADFDTGLVVMIIVVSVIGGVLVIAIFCMMFLIVHWNNCFGQTKHGDLKSHSYDQYRTHRTTDRFKQNRERSELNLLQPDTMLKGYQIYRGGVKNPIFEVSHENRSPPFVLYRETSDMLHEYPPQGYQYANIWRVLENN